VSVLGKVVDEALAVIADELYAMPAPLISGIVDLVKTVAAAPDVQAALERAKANVLADAVDAATDELADELLKAEPK